MSAIAEKIHLIERISADESATIVLLDKIIDSLLENDRGKLEQFREKLARFEAQYGMTTADFQRRFNAGELGDAMDWFEWDATADMAARLMEKFERIKQPADD